jgi:hypothetical protein
MTRLKRTLIRLDGGTQARPRLDADTVNDYCQILDTELRQAASENRKTAWPFHTNIQVVYDGTDYWLWDGYHRLQACELQTGWVYVEADITPGTRRDAILLAAGANNDHGLRRSPEAKRNAVLMLLNDPEWGQWSDREIARRCHVSNVFVSSLRKSSHTVNVNSMDGERTFVHKNGQVTKMKTANIGKEAVTAVAPTPAPPAVTITPDKLILHGDNGATIERDLVPAPPSMPYPKHCPRSSCRVDFKDHPPKLLSDGVWQCTHCLRKLDASGRVPKEEPAPTPAPPAPAPTAVWELERGIWSWLDEMKKNEWNGRIPETIHQFTLPELAKQREYSTYWKSLAAHLKEPWRSNDIVQALHNVKEQLRQRTAVNPAARPENYATCVQAVIASIWELTTEDAIDCAIFAENLGIDEPEHIQELWNNVAKMIRYWSTIPGRETKTASVQAGG